MMSSMKDNKNPKSIIWLRVAQGVLLILIVFFIVMSFIGISSADTGTPVPADNFAGLMMELYNMVAEIIGILAAVMVVIGGIIYGLSAGDPSKANLGKEIIISAITGLVLFMFAYFFLGDSLGLGENGGVIGRFFYPYSSS